jgi:hypothetical protein
LFNRRSGLERVYVSANENIGCRGIVPLQRFWVAGEEEEDWLTMS